MIEDIKLIDGSAVSFPLPDPSNVIHHAIRSDSNMRINFNQLNDNLSKEFIISCGNYRNAQERAKEWHDNSNNLIDNGYITFDDAAQFWNNQCFDIIKLTTNSDVAGGNVGIAQLDINANVIMSGELTVDTIKSSSTDVDISGNLIVSGNHIKSSVDYTTITLSGNDVTVAGDLTVSGNDIKSTDGTAITLYQSKI